MGFDYMATSCIMSPFYTYYPSDVNHNIWGNALLGRGLHSPSAFLVSEVIQHYSLTCMEERTKLDFIAVF